MRRALLGLLAVALTAPLALFAQAGRPAVSCDPGNGGLTLEAGFCAMVVAESVGQARHLVVSPAGDVYVAIRSQADAPGGIVALRDTNGDGRADVRERFAESGGTGIAIFNGHLYLSRDEAVVRFPLKAGQLLPAGPMEIVVSGFPQQRVSVRQAGFQPFGQ